MPCRTLVAPPTSPSSVGVGLGLQTLPRPPASGQSSSSSATIRSAHRGAQQVAGAIAAAKPRHQPAGSRRVGLRPWQLSAGRRRNAGAARARRRRSSVARGGGRGRAALRTARAGRQPAPRRRSRLPSGQPPRPGPDAARGVERFLRRISICPAHAAGPTLPRVAGGDSSSGNGCGWSRAGTRDGGDQPQVAAGLRVPPASSAARWRRRC